MLLTTAIFILMFFLVAMGLIFDIKNNVKLNKRSLASCIYLIIISFVLFLLVVVIFYHREFPTPQPQIAYLGGDIYA
ncbi:hypothetical protein IGL98_000680 [Enterococcus sp. DIV0840]|uniref:hypothetical protein n=1 Tax=Enterococcus TaxID=1350 RepID=UPI001A8F62CA|nr:MULTISPECIES: hypothetical protein [Enterococcus]MBO0434588.1 hypothetical protein [Enterococcus sp. DIV0849a]MBO0472193.1 hypothetical protein [Enterococcus ureasiticus]